MKQPLKECVIVAQEQQVRTQQSSEMMRCIALNVSR
jgi:hypothetical protein